MLLYGNHRLLVGLGILAVVIVTVIFWLCDSIDHPSAPTTIPRTKRATPHRDRCLQRYGGIELNYPKGSTTSFRFDLCDVISCGKSSSSWRIYDVYLCDTSRGAPGCPSWRDVIKSTGHNFIDNNRDPDNKFALQRDFSPSNNPLVFSVSHLANSPSNWQIRDSVCPSSTRHFYLVLGVDAPGKDPMELIRVNIVEKSQSSPPPTGNGAEGNNTEYSGPTLPFSPSSKVTTLDYSQLQPSEVIQMATGYTDDNLWLNWIAKSVKEQKMGDCVACASARPHLVTVPAPLFPEEDPAGYKCMIELTKGKSQNCTTLASLFPPIRNDTVTGPFTPDKANGSYVCFNFTTARCKIRQSTPARNTSIGTLDPSWCNITRPGEEIGTWARAGLYYYCGRRRLLMRIKPHMYGICAMLRLRTPLMLIGEKLTSATDERARNARLTRRRRRHILGKRSVKSFDLTSDSLTYIDAIGVPRGVPDEFKLANQITSGFENLPIVSAFFPVTPNKNVDRINYVHYNVLRLANLTRDAVEGLADQLGPTSLMAVQNRIALDMLLAEKGGICAMFGEMCCTFIPNNTAPDGSVSKALDGLRMLSRKMHEQSGIYNPLDDWMTGVFGQWKGIIMSLMISVSTFIAIMTVCGCCCIPCIRSLSLRLITTAIEGKVAGHMMPLLTHVGSRRSSINDEYVELRRFVDL